MEDTVNDIFTTIVCPAPESNYWLCGYSAECCTTSPLPVLVIFVSNGTWISYTAALAILADCRAPYLFAAVLQQAGAGQELLPLLADPARAAFQGLSITARHNRAFHIHPFLQVMTVANFSLQSLISFQQGGQDCIAKRVRLCVF